MICESMPHVSITPLGRFSALKSVFVQHLSQSTHLPPGISSQGCVHFSPGARSAYSVFTLNKSCCSRNPSVVDNCCREFALGYPCKSTLNFLQQIFAPILLSQNASGLPHSPSLSRCFASRKTTHFSKSPAGPKKKG